MLYVYINNTINSFADASFKITAKSTLGQIKQFKAAVMHIYNNEIICQGHLMQETSLGLMTVGDEINSYTSEIMAIITCVQSLKNILISKSMRSSGPLNVIIHSDSSVVIDVINKVKKARKHKEMFDLISKSSERVKKFFLSNNIKMTISFAWLPRTNTSIQIVDKMSKM